MRGIISLAVILIWSYSYAQVPDAAFTFPENPYTVCIGEKLEFDNTSTNATAYAWDFCPENFQEASTSTTPLAISNLTNGWGYKLVYDGSEWFGFLVSRNTNRIFRLDFGADPNSTPTVTDLGNPSNLFDTPQGIDIVNHQNKWYAFIGKGQTATGQIVRLDFGSNLKSVPTAVGLGTYSTSGRIRDLKVVKQGTNLILLLILDTSNSIKRINYRDSFDNAVSAGDITTTGTLTGANLPLGLSVTQVNGNWIVHTVSFSNNGIQQYNFGSNILGSYTYVGNYTFSSVVKPYFIKTIRQGADYYALVSNESAKLSVINFHDMSGAQSPTEVPNTNLEKFIGFDVVKYHSKSIIQGSVTGTSNFIQIAFENTACDVSKSWSNDAEPSDVYFTASGSKASELLVYSNSFDWDVEYRPVTVSNSVAPSINISYDNKCVNSNIAFTASSGTTLTSWSWDFGDASTSSSEMPTHQYITAAQYNASVKVEDVNTCIVEKKFLVDVFNIPVADFDLPTASPLCTNQSYELTNQSSVDLNAPIAWQWLVNNVAVATTEDLLYAFTGTSNQDITLVASTPGCSNQKTKNIASLAEGPLTSFSINGQCQNENIHFTNNSTGDIKGFQWDFGDSQTSMQTSPSHSFASIGLFNVKLTASDSNGCNNTFSVPLTIYTKPAVNFMADLPPFSCSGTSTYLKDQTPGPSDSNINSWQWNFGDPGSSQNTSVLKDPTHIYNLAGDYSVQLTVGTNRGCSGTIQKQIHVSETPVVNFSNSPACKDSPTTFTDQTPNAQSWNWSINGTLYATANPSHTFTSAGSKNVILNVTATNGCVASKSKAVVVPVALIPGFNFSGNCVSEVTLLTDTTHDATDIILNRKWTFLSGVYNTSEKTLEHIFSNAGNVAITMEVQATTGCKYAITKSVSIANKPFASITATPLIGGAPLLVQFKNNTTGATNYLWRFGDPQNSTSTSANPSFTYTDEGVYEVTLIASNAQQCSDETTISINAQTPRIDGAITQVELLSSSAGTFRPQITLVNNGNTPMTGARLIVNIDNQTQLVKDIPETIPVSGLYTYEVPVDILETGVKFVCAELELQGESNPSDNRNCLNIEGLLTILNPYPNPASNEINLEWISLDEATAKLVLTNSQGKAMGNWTLNANNGLNKFTISTDQLPAGLYLLKLNINNAQKTFRVVVGH